MSDYANDKDAFLESLATLINEDPTAEHLNYNPLLFLSIVLIQRLLAFFNQTNDLTDCLNGDSFMRLFCCNHIPTIDDLTPLNFDELKVIPIGIISTARLIWRANTPEKLLEVLPYVRIEERFLAVTTPDKQGKTALQLAITNPDLLKNILELVPSGQRLEAIKTKGEWSSDALQLIAENNPEYLTNIFEVLAPKDHPEAVQIALSYNSCDDTLIIKETLKYCPLDACLTALTRPNTLGMTSIMHRVAAYPETFQALLELFPITARFKALTLIDGDGKTTIHNAKNNDKSLTVIWQSLPPFDILTLVSDPQYSWSLNIVKKELVKIADNLGKNEYKEAIIGSSTHEQLQPSINILQGILAANLINKYKNVINQGANLAEEQISVKKQ